MTESEFVSCETNIKQMCVVKTEFDEGKTSRPRGFFSSLLSHHDLDEERERLQHSVDRDGRWGWELPMEL